ncbi:MAG: OsmC family protein [Candidatus Melainabacteria bacterium]|jgi:putative redox protein|nr:OsmC family protein [Candidatus Melainabacteria bacterium]
MTVHFTGKYLGNLRVQLKHGPSKSTIETDAPVDNNGKGEKFSPTDMLASSLAACMLTIMGIVAQRDEIDLSEVTFNTRKDMTTDSPRRVSKISVEFHLPATLEQKQRIKLENAAKTCPVHHSLHPDIEQEIEFKYL